MIPKSKVKIDGKELSCVAMGTHTFCLDSEKENRKVFEAFLEKGGNVIDTARCYGANATNPEHEPQSEGCIGKWLQSSLIRKDIFLITKGGNPEYKEGKFIRNRITERDIEEDINKSLEQLKTDYFDLYFLHVDSSNIEPGEAIEILNKYVKNGTIKHIGASNWTGQRIKEANSYAVKKGLEPFSFSEFSFSLKDSVTGTWGKLELALEMDKKEYDFYKESHIPVFGYNSQAYGFFYKEPVPFGATEKNIALYNKLRSISQEKGINVAKALFGFYFGCDITNIPLFSAKNLSRLYEVIDNLDYVMEKNEVEQLLKLRFND